MERELSIKRTIDAQRTPQYQQQMLPPINPLQFMHPFFQNPSMYQSQDDDDELPNNFQLPMPFASPFIGKNRNKKQKFYKQHLNRQKNRKKMKKAFLTAYFCAILKSFNKKVMKKRKELFNKYWP